MHTHSTLTLSTVGVVSALATGWLVFGAGRDNSRQALPLAATNYVLGDEIATTDS